VEIPKIEGFSRVKLLESYVDKQILQRDEEEEMFKMQWRNRKELSSLSIPARRFKSRIS
jgi:hypothetical protein